MKNKSEYILSVRIIQLLDKNNMSQVEFANRIKVHPNTVARWLNKPAFPAVNNLIEISKLFEISIDWLLGLTDER